MIADVKKSADQKMQKTVEALKADLGKVRTGRAHTGLLDHITVDYYGTPTPLKNLATINSPEPRMLTIQPFDPGSMRFYPDGPDAWRRGYILAPVLPTRR